MPQNSIKRKFLLLALALTLVFGWITPRAFAVSEEECKTKEQEEKWDDAERCWSDYFGAKKSTLQNEIDSKNAQINLTGRKIASTLQTITQLEGEISQLGNKISNLDVSLDQLSGILIKRIAATYKSGQFEALALFFSSKDFTDFVGRYKYLRVIQAHDRKLLLEMETTKTNFQDQKDLKEVKQLELEKQKKALEQEKIALDQAVKAQKILLSQTEASYQQALARIRAEKTKLSGASFYGKPAEFKEWSGDNNYFNQTDSRWAMMLIGGGLYDQNDPSYMWKYGCAVTSMAIVLKKLGTDINPGRLSQSPIYRTDLIAWQDVPGAGGFGGSIKVVGHGYGGTVSWTEIDNYLNQGKWVIVFVNSLGHYVVLLNKEGDDYKMHDPYFGPNLSFNSQYSKSSVDEMVIYSR